MPTRGATPPAVDPTLSTRERYEQHATDPVCKTCHEGMDPMGYALEHFRRSAPRMAGEASMFLQRMKGVAR